jgi:hypothetical protein
MAKPERFSPVALLNEPLTRAKWLAEKMALVLNDKDVSDVAVIVALRRGSRGLGCGFWGRMLPF